jgi:hypothetical protein
MPIIKIFCNCGPESNHEDEMEFSDETWAVMTKPERQRALDEMASDFMSNFVDYGAYVADDK